MSSINSSPNSLLRAHLVPSPNRSTPPNSLLGTAAPTGDSAYYSLNDFNNNNRNLNQSNTVRLTGINLLLFQNSLNASSETSRNASALLPQTSQASQASQETREALRRLFK